MKPIILALAALLLALVPEAAPAQVVTTLPAYINNDNSVYDFGNGPLEVRVLTGAAAVFTASGSGTGTAAGSTALTLTATPPVAPIVGGFVTCATPVNCTIPANTTVAAYNGTTGITLSASSTITAAVVNFGTACPSTYTVGSVKAILLQVGQPAQSDIPLYTQARVCAAAQYTTGAAVIPFPIGAH